MKTIKVVAAIIVKDNKILATQRGYGEFINQWEFPGGKVESGETKEEALIREIKEELNVLIEIEKFGINVKYQYPTFFLDMDCYIASIKKGEIELLEHNNAKWLEVDELFSVNWIPADIQVIEYLIEELDEHQ